MVFVEPASDLAIELIGEECFGEYADLREFFLSLNILISSPQNKNCDNVVNKKYYAGIGSRETPLYALAVMQFLSNYLSEVYTVRSGGADGADTAFELATGKKKEVFLPWYGFSFSGDGLVINDQKSLSIAELLIDGKFIKNISPLHEHSTQRMKQSKNESHLKLHRRNCFQILGSKLNSPIEFLTCWTDDKAITQAQTSQKTGGTGTAIRLASQLSIDVFNLSRDEHFIRILNKLKNHDKNIEDKIIERIRFFKKSNDKWLQKSIEKEGVKFNSEKEFLRRIRCGSNLELDI